MPQHIFGVPPNSQARVPELYESYSIWLLYISTIYLYYVWAGLHVGASGVHMPDQDTEYRKIQLTGGSTYVVSLPKDWIIENDLHKSDTVSVEELATGDLRISSIRNREIRRISVINTDDINEGLLDLMIGAYIAGADVIKFQTFHADEIVTNYSKKANYQIKNNIKFSIVTQWTLDVTKTNDWIIKTKEIIS